MHLGAGERAKGGKSPLHIKAVENAQNEQRSWKSRSYLWKSGLFSGKVSLLTRHTCVRSGQSIDCC